MPRIETTAIRAADAVCDAFGITTVPFAPTAVVLGSGLGQVAERLAGRNAQSIPFERIPHFPRTMVTGHSGQLLLGEVAGERLLIQQGRVHRYEGHSVERLVFPVRVLAALGVTRLVLTCAAGAVRTGMRPGDLMLIRDHINMTGDLPGASARPHPGFSEHWSPRLQDVARATASQQGRTLHEGVYACMPGPNYETPAEVRMLRTFGADAVGMSTIFEAIEAAALGMEVVGLAWITNPAAGLSDQPISHEEVVLTGGRVEEQLADLLTQLLCTPRV